MAMKGEEAQTSRQVEDSERRDYDSLDAFFYYKVWCVFLMREALAAMPDSPDDASPEEYRDILIKAGYDDVRLNDI